MVGRGRPFAVYGHRGTPLSAQENTLPSFEQSVAAGCGFETDLRRLADGTIVLVHDAVVSGFRVSSLTWEEICELSADVARLEELRPFSGRSPMILEVKETGWEQQVVSITRDWREVVISSFSLEVLAALKAAACEHPLGLIAEQNVPEGAALAAALGVDVYFPHYRQVTPELVASLHEQQIKVTAWSPNSPTIWNDLLEAGCDGLITDLPALAMQWLKTLT
ncbi:MAG: glycerophosphodiester phosphodiesterase [Acidobacteriota bacterium]